MHLAPTTGADPVSAPATMDGPSGAFGWFWQALLPPLAAADRLLTARTAPGTLATEAELFVVGENLFALPPDWLRRFRLRWLLDDPNNLAQVQEFHIAHLDRVYSPLLPPELEDAFKLPTPALGAFLAKTHVVPFAPGHGHSEPAKGGGGGTAEGALRTSEFHLQFLSLTEPVPAVVWLTELHRRPATSATAAASLAAMGSLPAPRGWWIIPQPGSTPSIAPSRALWSAVGGGVPVVCPSLREGFRRVLQSQLPAVGAQAGRRPGLGDATPPSIPDARIELEQPTPGSPEVASFRLTPGQIARGLRLPVPHDEGTAPAPSEWRLAQDDRWLRVLEPYVSTYVDSFLPGAQRASAHHRRQQLLESLRIDLFGTQPVAGTPAPDTFALATRRWEDARCSLPQLAYAFVDTGAWRDAFDVEGFRARLSHRSPALPWQFLHAVISGLPVREVYLEPSRRVREIVRGLLPLLDPPAEEPDLFVELIRLWSLAILRDEAEFSASFARRQTALGVRYLLSAVDYAYTTGLAWAFPEVALDSGSPEQLPGGTLLMPAVAYSARGQWRAAADCLGRLHHDKPDYFMSPGDIAPWNKCLLWGRLLSSRGLTAAAEQAYAWARATDLTSREQEFLLARPAQAVPPEIAPLPPFPVPWLATPEPTAP